MSRYGRFLTKEEKQVILALSKQNKTNVEIANRVGRSVSSIQRVLKAYHEDSKSERNSK